MIIPNNKNNKVPDGYFDSFADRLTIELELQRVLPKEKGEGYMVPGTYFSTLSRKLIHSTVSKEKSPKIVTLRRYLVPLSGIAAAIVILISMNLLQQSNSSEEPLSPSDIVILSEEDYLDINLIEIEDLLTDEDIDALSENLTVDQDATLDYLYNTSTSYDLYYK